MDDEPQPLHLLIAQLTTIQTIALNEVVMALHEANVLDKEVVLKRWKAVLSSDNEHITPTMRNFLELQAAILGATQDEKK
jgi:hypothetical protein